MILKQSVVATVGLVLVLGLAGCGGGTTTVQAQAHTQGQQLLDLKEALDQGVITQKEYDKAKERILKGE
ncbi:MAG: SHOCT domain-containing protein [Haliea sp.]|jgi:hypothetical protein